MLLVKGADVRFDSHFLYWLTKPLPNLLEEINLTSSRHIWWLKRWVLEMAGMVSSLGFPNNLKIRLCRGAFKEILTCNTRLRNPNQQVGRREVSRLGSQPRKKSSLDFLKNFWYNIYMIKNERRKSMKRKRELKTVSVIEFIQRP